MTKVFKICVVLAVCILSFTVGVGFARPRPTSVVPPEGKSDINTLRQFLATDNLNERSGSDSYTCVNFSADLVSRARVSGFSAVSVLLVTNTGPMHQIVAFYLADGTVVFVEPQTDGLEGFFNYPIVYAEVVE